MLILNAADVRRALPMTEAIAAMKEAFAAFSSGKLAAIKGTAAPQLLRALLAPTRAKRRSRSNPTRRTEIAHRLKGPPPTAARALFS